MTGTREDVRGAPRPEVDHRKGRRESVQSVFTVDRTEHLTPHLVRVHLGGPAFDQFVSAADPTRLGSTDKYVKLLFARPDLGLEPPYDLAALRETLAPEDMPVRRTYTVRSVDEATSTIAIDFVVHGDDGIAGPWADHAVAGDLLALSGPGGGFRPSTEPGVRHLFFGDDSAIPAIAAALEELTPGAVGVALVEVDSDADELPIAVPAGFELRWLHRAAGESLVDAVGGLAPPTGEVDVFAHGERESMKAVRAILQDGWGLERRALSLSAYWAQGRAEDAFQAEKREPVGQIFAD
jgi:NADPH-dependent ferric siderophore reductase